MTFRAKPVVNQPHRPSRDSQSRRNFYLNIGFGLAVVLAVADPRRGRRRELLPRAPRPRGDASTARPSPVTTSPSGARSRSGASSRRIARVNAAVGGRSTDERRGEPADSSRSPPRAARSSSRRLVVERLIDGRIQAGLAAEAGITVTPEQIDAKIVEESTTPEQRHAWIIAVAPEIDAGKDEPTDAQKAAAKKIADQALTDIVSGGKSWEDVAKAVSTDSSKASGGDLGWIDKDAAEDQVVHRCRLRGRAGQARRPSSRPKTAAI